MIRYFEIINRDTRESRELRVEGKFIFKDQCAFINKELLEKQKEAGDTGKQITLWNPKNCSVRELKDNALIIDDDQTWGLEFIPRDQLPENVLTFRYDDGKRLLPVYCILRDKDGKLRPYFRPKIIKTPPEKLYMYLFWYETKILFAAKYPDMGKFRQGIIIAIIILLIVFIWLTVS